MYFIINTLINCNYIEIQFYNSIHSVPTGWTARGSSPGGGQIFHAVQAGPKAQPAFCKMGTGYFPEVKCPEHGVDHRHPSRAELYMAWSCTSTFPLACSGLSYGDVYLFCYTFGTCAVRGTETNTNHMDSSIVHYVYTCLMVLLILFPQLPSLPT